MIKKDKKMKKYDKSQYSSNTTATTAAITTTISTTTNMNMNMHSLTMEYINKHKFEGTWSEEFIYKGIALFKGIPGRECGYMVEASSYFDKLWKLGQRSDRYMIVLQK